MEDAGEGANEREMDLHVKDEKIGNRKIVSCREETNDLIFNISLICYDDLFAGYGELES